MLIYAGIDEAGYGPMLGPLCVACTVFAVEGHDGDANPGAPDLWKRLKKVAAKAGRGKAGGAKKGRILVDDSKKLKGPRDGKMHPLKHLERGVLAFLAAVNEGPDLASSVVDGMHGSPAKAPGEPWHQPEPAAGSNGASQNEEDEERGGLPKTDGELMRLLGCERGSQPWWEKEVELPIGATEGELWIDAARLGRAMEENGVSMHGIRCEAIDAGAFNEQVDRMGSKAGVNWCSAMRLANEVMQRWGEHHPRIMIDRHGGRIHYRQDLQLSFPDAEIRIVEENQNFSRYVLNEGGRSVTINFSVESESKHLPVALASMTAKLVRELWMERFNRWFCGHMPELKPTAGYVEDGRRWMEEAEGVIRGLKIERRVLVRNV